MSQSDSAGDATTTRSVRRCNSGVARQSSLLLLTLFPVWAKGSPFILPCKFVRKSLSVLGFTGIRAGLRRQWVFSFPVFYPVTNRDQFDVERQGCSIGLRGRLGN